MRLQGIRRIAQGIVWAGVEHPVDRLGELLISRSIRGLKQAAPAGGADRAIGADDLLKGPGILPSWVCPRGDDRAGGNRRDEGGEDHSLHVVTVGLSEAVS